MLIGCSHELSICRWLIQLAPGLAIAGLIILATAQAGEAGLPSAGALGDGWVPAVDSSQVRRSGLWEESQLRYDRSVCLASRVDGATLTYQFSGTGVTLGLGQLTTPPYGGPELGTLEVVIDGGRMRAVTPGSEAREVVLARAMVEGEHEVRVMNRHLKGQAGCRISGFRVLTPDSGDLAFVLNGDDNGYFVDALAVVRRHGEVLRNVLVRNWLTGSSRLAGLPSGTEYSLELSAYGWKGQTIEGIRIDRGEETRLRPIYLERDPDARPEGVRFPVLGHPVVRRPGESFRVRVATYQGTIQRARLSRRVGPATISREMTFQEDSAAAFYYDKEGIAVIPPDTPPGLYDLLIEVSSPRGEYVRQSPHSVHVVQAYPEDPVFMTFGHLDTQGQYQAEYERRMAEMANLIAPDMVLISNAANPAYISGAQRALEVPYIITFGNHRFDGHERWYGDPVGVVDYGPDLCVLNFGRPWHVDLSQAQALLAARSETRIKVINAFEHNAPVESFLDRHGVQLIHDAHGPGSKVTTFGATPTTRVGKVSSSSFRVVRFKDGRATNTTHQGDDEAAIPFDREGESPLRVAYDPANKGIHDRVTAVVTNTLNEAFPGCRVTFVMPKGEYAVEGGRLEGAFVSDDGVYTVLTTRLDVEAEAVGHVVVRPR